MSKHPSDPRTLLMGFADGQLSAEDTAAFAAFLDENPDAAAEVAAFQRQTNGIQTLFAPAAAEPVPQRLRPQRLAAQLHRRRRQGWTWAAAAVVLVGIGLGAGWFARPLFETAGAEQGLIADAVNAHTVYVAENRHAVEVSSDDSAHLSSWLSNRLQTHLGMPDLAPEGFELVGGRLLPGAPERGGRAAQLMYQDANQQRITVYVTAALPDRQQTYQFANYEGAEAFYWANARITCTVVGTLPAGEMKSVSQAVYRQLTDGDVTWRS